MAVGHQNVFVGICGYIASMDEIMVLQCLLLVFPAVIFLQSGLDKVFNFEENKNYINAVFALTFLKPMSGMLFYLLLIMELITGALAIVGFLLTVVPPGIFVTASKGAETVGYYTFLLSVIILTGLLAGQRIARDYAGAAGLVPYLILAFVGLYIFTV